MATVNAQTDRRATGECGGPRRPTRGHRTAVASQDSDSLRARLASRVENWTVPFAGRIAAPVDQGREIESSPSLRRGSVRG